MSLQQLQAILDDNKQDIPEGVYLSLCNNLKELHEAAEGIYIVQYFEYFQIEPLRSFQQMETLPLNTYIMYLGKPHAHQEVISLLMKQHEVKLHCVTDEQLMSLQARLETLHSSSLLTDDVRSIVQACMQGLVLTRTDYCYMRVGTVGARGHHRGNDRRCN